MSLLHIFLCIVLLHSVPTFASNKASCLLPRDVMSVIQNRYNLTLHDTKISISYDLDNASTKTLPKNIVELSLSTASVSFKSVSSYVGRPAHEISFNFATNPIAVYHKQNGEKRNCRAESSANFGISLQSNNEDEEAAVIQLTEYCIQNLLCDNFDSIVRQNLIYNDSCSELLNHIYNPQNTINAMMDFGASVIISKLANNKDGVFDIPEIKSDFEVSWLYTTGNLTASNGKFSDLRKLKRVSDMVFTHDGLRFSVGSTYSLSNAKATFSYRARFGFINFEGDISVDIRTLTAKVKVSFDYNNSPCQATLDELTTHGFDQTDVDITGFRPFNGKAADIIKEKIKSGAEDSLKQAIAEKLNELECEKFRPV